MTTISVTGVPTIRFFVVNRFTFAPVLKAPDGSVLVYCDREKAKEAAEAAKLSAYCIVGMGTEKWALFQQECKFTLVE